MKSEPLCLDGVAFVPRFVGVGSRNVQARGGGIVAAEPRPTIRANRHPIRYPHQFTFPWISFTIVLPTSGSLP
ncbi:hypothetical protein GK047_16235 [Paenibacillus sp. SYP-B3998]|uniref:Uncharacterized protein n=1 Tax=Paenibacillus sp. SYP-B3998 TaxID=2678564 RepID=A0A6G3ZZB0_9BACL|nr:hypothetical protein [Paenibacillus sp. SYP-B3998]NEW07556.1 hypothetical protein [Paenibacillus sp. SYP-B3998]